MWGIPEIAVERPCYPRRPMRLIVTEKNSSAKKIAEILGAPGGGPKSDKTFKVPFYAWTDDSGEEQMTVGLKGHVLGPAFPEGYSNWQKTDLHDLIDAELIKEPTDKNVVKAIKKLAKGADELVIATDFDREGELIGLEALEEMLDANPQLGNREETDAGTLKVLRARYSALTKEEIERAFSELDYLSYPLANAGAARQDIDLLWGATLTRAVSLASRRFGSNFLSVGRVQSPTLGLIVEREMERRAHVAKPFWEVFAKFEHPDGAFEAHHATDKFWEKAEADAALAGTSSPGTVKAVTARKNTRRPPTPYNTTAFSTDASSRLGITPASAMRIAEDLYMDGFISYPAHRQHRLPGLAAGARAGLLAGPGQGVLGRLGPARGRAETDPRQKRDDRPPADLPDPGDPPGRARRLQEAGLRTRRPPLPRHLQPADDHRVDPRRHRGRRPELLRPRLGRRRPRLRRHLHLRPLRRRGDPGAAGGPGAAAVGAARGRRRGRHHRQSLAGGEGDPAAVADLAGETDRDDGGARARHQSDPRRHHPEAVRPRLRLRQPAGPLGDRDRPLRGVQELRPGDGDAGDDGAAGGGDGPDRRRRHDQAGRRRREPRTAAQDLDRNRRQPRRPGESDLERDGRGPHPRPLQGLRRSGSDQGGRLAQRAADHPRQKIGQTLRRLQRLGSRRPRLPATRPSRCPSAATSSGSKSAARSATRRRGSKSSPSAAGPGTSASTTTASRCRR